MGRLYLAEIYLETANCELEARDWELQDSALDSLRPWASEKSEERREKAEEKRRVSERAQTVETVFGRFSAAANLIWRAPSGLLLGHNSAPSRHTLLLLFSCLSGGQVRAPNHSTGG